MWQYGCLPTTKVWLNLGQTLSCVMVSRPGDPAGSRKGIKIANFLKCLTCILWLCCHCLQVHLIRDASTEKNSGRNSQYFLKTFYKILMNFLQTSYKCLVNFSLTCYKILMNLLQMSYELLTNFLWNFYKPLSTSSEYLVNSLQTSYDVLINILCSSLKLLIKVLWTFHKLLMNFFETSY